MNLNKLSKEELLKIKSDHYNMEQFLIYVEKIENAHKLINKVCHKSMIDKNWQELQQISDKIMEYI